MPTAEIGEQLRRRREELGWTLEHAQAVTNIRSRYLAALEKERIEDLPPPVFSQGFLRLYANVLGLDGDALVREFRAAQAVESAEPADLPADPTPSRLRQPGRRRQRASPRAQRWVVGVGAATIVLLAAALLHHPARRTASPAAPPGATGPQGTSPPPAGPARTTPGGRPPSGSTAPASPGVQLTALPPAGETLAYRVQGATELKATARFDAPCWIRAQADGGAPTERTYEPGQTATWTAQRSLDVRVGYPPGLHLTLDGVPVPPIASRDPRTLQFTLTASALTVSASVY